jgi:GTPase SAR1 family protein
LNQYALKCFRVRGSSRCYLTALHTFRAIRFVPTTIEKMFKTVSSNNEPLEEYLNYYCNLSTSPGFAVLLKGQWGSGKTWLIKKFIEKAKNKNKKCLYISLYGVVGFSDIEEMLFQQLHPVLSSKGMALTGKIFKGLLKASLKIDLNNDSKEDGTANLQIPDINLPEYLKNTENSILIFDDLERCKLEISDILGYINYFVEQQELKVILIANEEELNKDKSYIRIKEKLIGKTFSIIPDFEEAVKNFISSVKNTEAKKFLSGEKKLIEDLFKQTEYVNLRVLKQIILDYERIFEILPVKAKNKPEIPQDFLKLLIAFSIEIKRGSILPADINLLQEAPMFVRNKSFLHGQKTDLADSFLEKKITLSKILDKYPMINLATPFPSSDWWESFLDKGFIDKKELEISLSNGRYFEDENTPNWIRLWYFHELSDNEFVDSLKKVELEYSNREYTDLGIIKHVFGIFLTLANAELYHKDMKDLLEDSKSYIDELAASSKLCLDATSKHSMFGGYKNLGFYGKEFQEFQEFDAYIQKAQEKARIQKMPRAAEELLEIMQDNVWKFYSIICLHESQVQELPDFNYYEIPIFKYADPSSFMKKFMSMKSRDQRSVFGGLKKRYDSINSIQSLREELDFFKSLKNFFQAEISNKEGKLSGYLLDLVNKEYLDIIISKLGESV